MSHEHLECTKLDALACDLALGEGGSTRDVLASIQASDPGVFDVESYELAAAAINLAFLPSVEPMPVALHSRVLATLQGEIASTKASGGTNVRALTSAPRDVSTGRFSPMAGLGWVAAAAAIVVAAFAWRSGPTALTPDLRVQRQQFVSAGGDVGVWNWVDFAHPVTQETPEIKGVKGDVCWSSTKQEGFLRLNGLPRNASTVERYQLWIIDKRGLEQRVNAGVFDSTGDETVVHFKPELMVDGPVIFAVTIEPPEGVVVSNLKRRVCAAITSKS